LWGQLQTCNEVIKQLPECTNPETVGVAGSKTAVRKEIQETDCAILEV